MVRYAAALSQHPVAVEAIGEALGGVLEQLDGLRPDLMVLVTSPHHSAALDDIRDAVRDLCQQFPDEYHRKIDEQRAYPEAFVDALTKAGWMAALIPQEYGGSGLGLTEASVIMEEINRSGRAPQACGASVRMRRR